MSESQIWRIAQMTQILRLDYFKIREIPQSI